jgi:hypothetical protein
MLSEPGGLYTDPETGRRFTVDRFGNYKAVNQPTGYRKVSDAYGNVWTIPVEAGQFPNVQPGIPSPQMYQAGGQSYLLQTGRGAQRIPRTEEEKYAGRQALERATAKAQSIFNEILEWKKLQQQGRTNTRLGLGQPIPDRIAQLEKDLEGLGFLPSGQPKPGTDLYRAVFGEEGPPTGGQLGPAQQGVMPPGQGGMGYPTPIGPVRPPRKEAPLVANPRFGTSPWEPRMIPAGPATRGGFPVQAAPTTQLGPNQVKKYWKGKAVIWDTKLNKAVDWYAE